MAFKLPRLPRFRLRIHPRHWWESILQFCRQNWRFLATWCGIILFIILAYFLHIKKAIVVAVVFIVGLMSQAFSWLVALIALIPVAGPLIAKVLMLPVFWILNALGYFVSVVAIKKGYKRDVINYRLLTIAFLIGFAVGFIFAQLF